MKVKVGLVQMSCVKDKETNIQKAEAEIRKAANSGTSLFSLYISTASQPAAGVHLMANDEQEFRNFI